MIYKGNLSKMRTVYKTPVQYFLTLGDEEIMMNDLIGKDINIDYEGVIHCRVCGRKIKKAYGEGFCYPDFLKSPQNSPCIIHPEKCEAHLGKGRDMEWEKAHHLQPHIVYLALSSGLKVGVTRATQVPTRWIDQGAWKAGVIAETPYRRLAGEIEVALKQYVSDKTPWQKMLKNVLAEDVLLEQELPKIRKLIENEFGEYIVEEEKNGIMEIVYPVVDYPTKVKSVTLDKVPKVSGQLMGIKGQYLIFEEGKVINIRRHTGYEITLQFA